MSSELKPKDYKEIRKLVFQFSFQEDCKQVFNFSNEHFKLFCEQNEISSIYKEFLENLLNALFSKLNEINDIISQHSKNWPISRINKVDLAILRLAVTELLIRNDTDYKIIVSEATEIAKNFGAASSSSFVNGILDSIAKNVRENKGN